MAEAGTTSANDHHIAEVAISIRERLKGLSPLSDCCIFTVPKRLRRSNEEAYTPRAVAIGPYHRRKESLKRMENHKQLYLRKLLEEDDRLEEYIESLKSCENEARSCYDEPIKLNSNEFTEMMLLDGIFVIQIFVMYTYPLKRLTHDRIFGRPRMVKDVRRDMTLLENQIPFFIIQGLFDMAFGTQYSHRPQMLLELMYEFFSLYTEVEIPPKEVRQYKPKHIVDALRLLFLPPESKAPFGNTEDIKFSPSATELVAAGVELKRGESKCLFDIKFENGELEIPCLVLYDMTESFFRNIIAFEECYYHDKSEGNLLSYMAFMDHLVDTPIDTELLMDKGIIENWLSDKEAATDLINAFCKETSMSTDEYHFFNLSKELIEHCQRPHNKWKATLKREYCSNPWVVISIIAAGTLLLLTVVQTVCSVLSLES